MKHIDEQTSKIKGKPYWYHTICHPKSSVLFSWCVFHCVTLHAILLNCAVLAGIELIFFTAASIRHRAGNSVDSIRMF